MSPDDYIPYFLGGLSYNDDDTDVDLDVVLNSKDWNTSTAPMKDPDMIWVPDLDRREIPDQRSHRAGGILSGQLSQEDRHRQLQRSTSHINRNILPKHLITSRHPAHSAVQLCNDSSSAGPDFVSHVENVYCDMAKKRVYPLCLGHENEITCFHLPSATFHVGGNEKRDMESLRKRYGDGLVRKTGHRKSRFAFILIVS